MFQLHIHYGLIECLNLKMYALRSPACLMGWNFVELCPSLDSFPQQACLSCSTLSPSWGAGQILVQVEVRGNIRAKENSTDV